MPHEMGYCDCGREIHFPHTARYGDTWRCHRCGKTWTLVPGRMGAKPGYLVESRRPKPKPRPKPQVIVVVRETQPPAPRQRALPPPTARQLPAPPRRGGLISWLLGE